MSIVALQLGAQTITNYTTTEGLISDFVECIDVDVYDNIWFGTSLGAQGFNQSVSSWETYNLAGPLSGMVSENIKEIKLTKNPQIVGQEQFWIGTDFGAQLAINSFWITYDNTNGLVGNQVKSIDEDENGGKWIGTSQGVSYFGDSLISYSSPDLHWSGVNATAFDSNGDSWFASPLGGVTHFDGVTFTNYNTSNGLLSQNVTALLIDNQDNKKATLNVNGHLTEIDQIDPEYSRNVDSWLEPGNNYVEIKPKSDIHIVELKVELE